MLSLHYISRDEYNNADASSKTSDKLFFLSDTHEIFRGTENFTESVIFYDEEPTTKIAGKLYINQNTLVGRIWNGIDWITVAEPQVQSDYENNDNTSKSFILNRPFYDSRNTISRTYGFDGSTNGKTVLNTADANAKYIKVSDDLILNKDILVGGTLVSVGPNSEGTGTEESSISIDQVYTINANESGKYVYALVSSIAPYVLVAKEDCSFIDVYSSDSSSINITAGVYFLYQAADNYVKSLTFSYESGELKTIDPKFIPWESSPAAASVLYTEQTLTDEQKTQARMNIEACDRTHRYEIVESLSNIDNNIDLLDASSEYSTIGSIIQLKAIPKILMKSLIYPLAYGHAETYDSVLSVNTYDNNLNFDASYEYSTSDTGYSTISAIDANNYKCTLKIRNVDCFEVYFISNTSTLTEEYSSSFSATGVYLKYLATPSYASQYLRIKFKVLQYYKLSDHYLDSTVERTKNKVTAISDSVTDDQYPSALSVKTELDKTIKITEQTLTDEQKSQARTNIGAGGLQVQSDYTQNDNTQTDYIKNRPFYEDTLIDVIWDGNTTGKTEVDLTSALGFNVYLVSDATPSAEDLIGATLSIYTGSDTMEIPLGSEYVQTISDNIILLAEGNAFVIIADNSEYNGITFPSKGTYFVNSNGAYVSGISKKVVNKIDKKFIPNGIDTLKITVTYNSSTDTYSNADKSSDDIESCLNNGGIPYIALYGLTSVSSDYIILTYVGYGGASKLHGFANEEEGISLYISGLSVRSGLSSQSLKGRINYLEDITVKTVSQVLTDEQKTQARTNIGAGVPQVQSDYTQNDSGQTDYIKNRPFYEYTAVDITWDGDTTGKTEVDLTSILGCNVYLVSDATPSVEDLNGSTLTVYDGSSSTEQSMTLSAQALSENVIMVREVCAFVVLADNSEVDGITFPSKGTYLASLDGSYMLRIIKEGINKIDPKFIPNGIDTLKVTVTYNSSTDTYSADKTSDDIKTCLDNGGIPYVYFKSGYSGYYTLTSYSADLRCYCFSNIHSPRREIDIHDSGDVTVVEDSKFFNNLEYTDNKVTAIDNTATNYQYPSALAVKTALDGKLDASHFIIDSNNNITGIKIKDQVNDYNYILRVKDGTFTVVRADAIVGIKVTTNPTKMSYNAGDYIDTTGMVVSAEYGDGTLREIIDYTCDNYVTVDNPVFTITYTENNVVYSTGLTVNVTAFDPSVVLADFTYTDNGDGTYTITGWNGTYNGVTSTELIIPDNAYIIL